MTGIPSKYLSSFHRLGLQSQPCGVCIFLSGSHACKEGNCQCIKNYMTWKTPCPNEWLPVPSQGYCVRLLSPHQCTIWWMCSWCSWNCLCLLWKLWQLVPKVAVNCYYLSFKFFHSLGKCVTFSLIFFVAFSPTVHSQPLASISWGAFAQPAWSAAQHSIIS